MVSINQIKALREETGVSIGQCREALERAGGDEAKAREFLRGETEKIAAKKAGRQLGAGCIGSYVHQGVIGAMVELRSETDFVAKNPAFKALADDMAMQLSAIPAEGTEDFLAQPFIKNPDQTIADLIKASIQKFGERIELSTFSRLAVN